MIRSRPWIACNNRRRHKPTFMTMKEKAGWKECDRKERFQEWSEKRRLNPVEEIMPRILQNQRLTYELMAALFGEAPIELPTRDEDNWKRIKEWNMRGIRDAPDPEAASLMPLFWIRQSCAERTGGAGRNRRSKNRTTLLLYFWQSGILKYTCRLQQ